MIICIKMDLVLNNLQGLIYNKTQPTNQPTNQTNKQLLLVGKLNLIGIVSQYNSLYIISIRREYLKQ